MSTVFWPGDERAGGVFSERAFVRAALEVETAWLRALARSRIAPAAAAADLTELLDHLDVRRVADAAEASGNPVVALLAAVRELLPGRGHDDAARWVHRGLTSQDVVDTALMLLAREARERLTVALHAQVATLAALAERHRATPMVGRTLTQPAVPITFGAKAASWLAGLLDAADDLGRLTFPAQFGGAAGTLSGASVLTAGGTVSAVDLCRSAAAGLGLAFRSPWHTDRAPVTRVGEAFTRCTAAWGRIANDVLTLSRPEIGELSEPVRAGRGGSSAMPQKVNPVLSTLIRRAALAAPAHLLPLHLAAADTGDERPAGAWHLEWEPLRLLARHAVTAADQASELLGGLRVDPARMAQNLAAAGDVGAERRALLELAGRPAGAPSGGAEDALVDLVLGRAAAWTAGFR